MNISGLLTDRSGEHAEAFKQSKKVSRSIVTLDFLSDDAIYSIYARNPHFLESTVTYTVFESSCNQKNLLTCHEYKSLLIEK